MKRLLLAISMVVFFAQLSVAQLVSVTCTKKDGVTISSTVFKLNPEYIMYVKKATTPTIGYQDLTRPGRIMEYVVTEIFDTVINQANRPDARLVKVLVSSMVAGTARDTTVQWAYPFRKFLEVAAKTKASQTSLSSVISMEQVGRFTKIYVNETGAILKSRTDSLQRVARNFAF